ncbi:MAG: hypothetical protein P4L79_09835 [Legionella sp.]|uniref:hypothetical protein n=1 Tax=Legionella sp. TaxID=459 RepID=UPI00283F1CBC|nr:hypothetical protein [Legionella sp.]
MSDSKYSVNSQAFTFSIVGAKPYTQYNVYSDGFDLSCRVKPFGRNLGETLLSDQSGKLNFILFYLDVPEKVGLVKNFQSIAAKTTDVQSDKIIYISDLTNTSVFTRTIPFCPGRQGLSYNLTN